MITTVSQVLKKYFDKELKNKTVNKSFPRAYIDTNIQYLISKELDKALKTFNATGRWRFTYGCHKWRYLIISFTAKL